MDIRRFLKKRPLPDYPDTTAVSRVPRLAGDDSISTLMNSQEGKDVGNDRSECNDVNCTQPQQSTSKVSSITLSEDTEVTQVSGSKGAITGKKLKFQPHWQKKYSWINYNSVTNGMLCQLLFPYLQGRWGSAEAHTARLDLFPSVQLEKSTG